MNTSLPSMDPVSSIKGMSRRQLERVLMVTIGNAEPETHQLLWSVIDYVVATTPEDEYAGAE